MTTKIQKLSKPPVFPTRLDPTTFDDRADEALTYFPNTLEPELNSVTTTINTVGDEIEQIGSDSQDAKTDAESAAQAALASSNFKGSWPDLSGSISIPASVYNVTIDYPNGVYWMLLVDLPDVTAKEPGVDPEWVKIFRDSLFENNVDLAMAQAVALYF